MPRSREGGEKLQGSAWRDYIPETCGARKPDPRIYASMLQMGPLQDMQNNYENPYQAADDLTMLFGSHNIQVGIDVRLLQQNTLSSGLLYSCCGSYDFTSANPTASGNANIPTGSGGATTSMTTEPNSGIWF